MLELGQNQNTAAAAGDLIKDVSEADFMAEVIEASQTVPVIVDFWAPWCGPCKTLGPALEAAVTKAKGAVRMAKVNVDENQMIAGQLRVQSIPTVYAFWQGQPIDGFQGAVAQSELDAFIGRIVASIQVNHGGKRPRLAHEPVVDRHLKLGQVADAQIQRRGIDLPAVGGILPQPHAGVGGPCPAASVFTDAEHRQVIGQHVQAAGNQAGGQG